VGLALRAGAEHDMEFDVFFSISQTPVNGYTPSEAEMFQNFFDQVGVADELGYGVAWVAESHFSSEVQKTHKKPVIPHWQGEVGLNTDILQLATHVFARTRRIEVGSAVMNILVNGGPVAAAERIATFLALHGLDSAERRRLHVGFAAGRFDFMARTTGVVPRNELEEAAWSVLKGKLFAEAAEVFLRLLAGETLNSDRVRETQLTRRDFRTDEEWERVRAAAGAGSLEAIPVPRRFVFENTKIIPQEFRRDLLNLVIGSHEAALQESVNRICPVQIFNLSITASQIIDDTHRRMAAAYHRDGGPWKRSYMPRTVMVFVNEEAGLAPEARRRAAHDEAREALGAYWTALEGTLDPARVQNAAENSLVGTAEDVAQQIVERFHPKDRLMLWFDFFNHDSPRVIRNMRAFMHEVRPLVEKRLAS
jgi:alkanesulfonate monooxygenase SsuD/methylene tetrahydromethanopterin reductase-like flavin-dependent oxidoreductase (luciferase family)